MIHSAQHYDHRCLVCPVLNQNLLSLDNSLYAATVVLLAPLRSDKLDRGAGQSQARIVEIENSRVARTQLPGQET